ncbi:MAG: hypothetical protein P4L98_04400 [Ancalomicrobiaceae bacterium]|nr:hypothetical protein [Ancalomicrobiaceae bacterium]
MRTTIFLSAVTFSYVFLSLPNPGLAEEAGAVQLDLGYTLVKDRLSPHPKAGIVDERSEVITLSGTNAVRDSHRREAKRTLSALTWSTESELGRSSDKTQWTVDGPHGLRGVIKMGDGVALMQVAVDDGSASCRLEVRILPPNGSSEIHAKWAKDPRLIATFTNLRVTATSCRAHKI